MASGKLDPCKFGKYEDRAGRSYRHDPSDPNCTVQAVCIVGGDDDDVSSKAPLSKEEISITDNSAVSLTVPANACDAIIQFNVICARFCIDGTVPTSTTGFSVGDGAVIKLTLNEMASFQAIAEAGFIGELIVSYNQEI